MRRLVVAAFLFSSIVSIAQSTSVRQECEQLVASAIQQKHCIGIGAGFSKGNGEVWAFGAGLRDIESDQPFEFTTKTRIASITKPMTAIAVMQLYERGLIDLDNPIQQYLPAFPEKKEGVITVKQLLQHTAGIEGYKTNKEQENTKQYSTLEDAMSIFKDRQLISTPGLEFNYSTYGYVILGALIESVSGKSYEEYLQENIWNKAGMTNTGIESIDTEISMLSKIYHRNSKGKIAEAKRTNLSDRIPGGGVYSTVSDMLLFGDAVLNNTLVSESTLKLMIKDSPVKKEGSGYGLGWYLYGINPKYGNVFGHTGAQTGASAFLMLLPDEQTSIIVLSNTSGAMNKVSEIAVKLFDLAYQFSE